MFPTLYIRFKFTYLLSEIGVEYLMSRAGFEHFSFLRRQNIISYGTYVLYKNC